MSADPRPLFYVASFVIAALALWVISVLARKGEPWARPAAAPDAKDQPPPAAPSDSSTSSL